MDGWKSAELPWSSSVTWVRSLGYDIFTENITSEVNLSYFAMCRRADRATCAAERPRNIACDDREVEDKASELGLSREELEKCVYMLSTWEH